MLTTRDVAALLWLAVLFAFALARSDIRRSLWSVLVAFRPFVLAMALYAGYVALIVYGAYRLGLWDAGLMKESVVWFLVSGMALFFSFLRSTEPKFFWRTTVATVRASVFVGFYLNLVTFPLLMEIVLQPALVTLALLSVVGGMRKDAQPAKRLADGVLAMLVLGMFVFVGARVLGDWQSRDAWETLRSLALPVWLTIGVLPFIYGLSLWANYQGAFVQINFYAKDGRSRRRAKLALLLTPGPRRDLERFVLVARDAANAPNLAAAREAIRDFRARQRAKEAAKQKEADDLKRYAGVLGTDAEGRQLDRREFIQTTDALELLHSVQMGRYRRDGRYRKELLKEVGSILFSDFGEDHGITMKVRKDGRAWYAWRRTTTGWCFATGASGPPPSLWFHDGPEPPKGYPGSHPAWTGGQHEPGRNWES